MSVTEKLEKLKVRKMGIYSEIGGTNIPGDIRFEVGGVEQGDSIHWYRTNQENMYLVEIVKEDE